MWNLFPIIRDLKSLKYVGAHISHATSCSEELLRQILLWAKGNVARINRSSCEVQDTLLRKSTQPILQPTISLAITLNLQQSNCDGCTWPR